MKSNHTASINFYLFYKASITLFYGFIFFGGICGNLWMLYSVIRVLKKRSSWKKARLVPEHLYIYMGALATGSIFVLSVIPFLTAQLNFRNWTMGDIPCKYFWSVENVNKLLTIGILTALSIDRYYAVCRPLQWHRSARQHKQTAYRALGGCLLVSVLSLLPVMIYARVVVIELPARNGTEPKVIRKCLLSTDIPIELFNAFALYLFVLGYCIPALIIAAANGRIICFLRSKKSMPGREMCKSSNIQLVDSHSSENVTKSAKGDDWRHQVQQSVYKATIFYYVCWTPYWVSNLFPLILTPAAYHGRPTLVYMMMFIHTLPYVNCAGNWIIYALLNGQLRQLGKEADPEDQRKQNDMQLKEIRRWSISESQSYRILESNSLVQPSDP